MKKITTNRRNFLKYTAGAATLAAFPTFHAGAASARVVVVGGGFGGATCAAKLKKLAPGLNVTLVEPNKTYYACPFSNLVIGGLRDIKANSFGYGALKSKYGVNVVHQSASAVDAGARKVRLGDGSVLSYDKLVVSPGIDFKFDALEGYSEADSEAIPHAYKAGGQTLNLKKQLESMKDGGVFALIPPPNPFRCPPGPYERVSVVANYLKNHKPKSKILIFDPKPKFSKQALFQEGWEKFYGDMIKWYSPEAGGVVEELDVKNKVVVTEFGEEKVDVINYIPPQKAGKIAIGSGLANDGGWCPVNPDFSSKLADDVFVIGDASIAGAMPKSGFSANNQAKYVALKIVASLNGDDSPAFKLNNVCYSYVGEKYSISVSAVYEIKDDKVTNVGGSTSPKGASANHRHKESLHAEAWFNAITAEMFA